MRGAIDFLGWWSMAVTTGTEGELSTARLNWLCLTRREQASGTTSSRLSVPGGTLSDKANPRADQAPGGRTDDVPGLRRRVWYLWWGSRIPGRSVIPAQRVNLSTAPTPCSTAMPGQRSARHTCRDQ